MLSTGQLSFSFGLPGTNGSASPPVSFDPSEPPTILVAIRRRLLAIHGRQQAVERPDPVAQLVNAMISTRTRDAVSFPTFKRLWHHYRSWHAVSRAPYKEIERIIRPVTHAEKKAEQIPDALRMILARSGSLDLMFLKNWPEERSMAWLMALPGTGPKVAATTLNWSILRKRVLAVDTHLLRVGKRLGLLPENADYGRGYETFMRLVPDSWDADDLFEFHWLMKLHSQQVCVYESPACFRCPLRDLCPHGTTRH